jgi:cell division protein FtsN
VSNTPIGRDFKRAGRRGGSEFSFSREFFAGLAAGLAVAVGVFFWQQQAVKDARNAVEEDQPTPRPVRREPASAAATETEREYDFYGMLPKSEVVVPETDPKAPVPAVPNTPIVRPGVYVLQLGMFKKLDEAERLQAKLLRLGVQSAVQRIAIESEVLHRVRIGPVSNLNDLNRTRAALQRAEIDAVVIRVGD